MNELQKLQARRRELANQLKAHGEREATWTDQDRQVVKALIAEFDGVNAAVKAEEDRIKAAAAERQAILDRLTFEDYRPAGAPAPGAPVPISANQHTDAAGRLAGYLEETDEQVTLSVAEGRGIARQSYREQRKTHNRLMRSSGYRPWGEFRNFRDFVRAGMDGHAHSSFRDRVSKHYNALGMSEAIGADGGFTVMPEFAAGITDRVYANDLWGRTDNYTVTGNNMTFLCNAETSRATGSRHGGLRAYYVGEGGTITSSKPTLREVSLKLIKAAAVVYLTQELIDDTGTALQEYVTRKVSEEFNFLMGDALINGTGVGQPVGILTSLPLISVAKETSQSTAAVDTENIVKMFARFYAPNRGNMVWLHNQDIEPELFTMTLAVSTAGGMVTYMPPGGLSASPYGTLMGRPLLPTEFNATLGTQGDIIAADLGQILSISKGGVAQAVSMHVQFLTDQVALRFTIRFNACPWENAPITPYKGTATQSNFVTLDARP